MKLILIRHGQTIWNTEMRTQGRTDIPLNETGFLQAQHLAKRLAEEEIARESDPVIYTSPLSRALDTAQILARQHSLPIITSALLMERNFGLWEGKPFSELKIEYPKQVAAWDSDPYAYTPPEAEPLSEVVDRCKQFLAELNAAYTSTDTIIVVGHSIPQRLMIATLIGLPPSHLHNLRLDNAAYTEIRTGTRHNILYAYNDTSHLGGIS